MITMINEVFFLNNVYFLVAIFIDLQLGLSCKGNLHTRLFDS